MPETTLCLHTNGHNHTVFIKFTDGASKEETEDACKKIIEGLNYQLAEVGSNKHIYYTFPRIKSVSTPYSPEHLAFLNSIGMSPPAIDEHAASMMAAGMPMPETKE